MFFNINSPVAADRLSLARRFQRREFSASILVAAATVEFVNQRQPSLPRLGNCYAIAPALKTLPLPKLLREMRVICVAAATA